MNKDFTWKRLRGAAIASAAAMALLLAAFWTAVFVRSVSADEPELPDVLYLAGRPALDVTSLLVPDPYYVTGAITLGSAANGNLKTYNRSIMLHLHGPFGPPNEMFMSQVSFDITGMPYTHFTAWVGSMYDPDTNVIKYVVSVDGVQMAETAPLVKGEVEFISVQLPVGAKRIRLLAYSTQPETLFNAYGQTVWGNASLRRITDDMPGVNIADLMPTAVASDGDTYNVGAQTIDGITYVNSIMLAIKESGSDFISSATYNISDYSYNQITVGVGSPWQGGVNNIIYSILADGVEIASTGTGIGAQSAGGFAYQILTGDIPLGTQQLRLLAVSATGKTEYGLNYWYNPTLSFAAQSPSIVTDVESAFSGLRWGDPLPELIAVTNVEGTIKLDAGQTLIVGTNSYNWTFTPNSAFYAAATGTVELTVGKALINMSGVTFSGKVVDYDGEEHEIVITGTLPANVTVTYEFNKGTEAGTYAAKAKFTYTGANAANYEAIPDMTATLIINEPDDPGPGDGKEEPEDKKNCKKTGTEAIALAFAALALAFVIKRK